MREKLKALGLSTEQIDEIMKEHGQTVNSLNDDLKEKDRKINSLESDAKAKDNQISKYEKEINNLKDNEGAEDLQNKIDDLEKEVKRIKKEKDQEVKQANIKRLADLEVMAHDPHDPEDVIAFIDMEKVDLSEDGKSLVGFSDQVEALKERKKHFFKVDPSAGEGEGEPGTGEGEEPPKDPKPPYSGGNPQRGNSAAGGGGDQLSDYEKGRLAAEQRHKEAQK